MRIDLQICNSSRQWQEDPGLSRKHYLPEIASPDLLLAAGTEAHHLWGDPAQLPGPKQFQAGACLPASPGRQRARASSLIGEGPGCSQFAVASTRLGSPPPVPTRASLLDRGRSPPPRPPLQTSSVIPGGILHPDLPEGTALPSLKQMREEASKPKGSPCSVEEMGRAMNNTHQGFPSKVKVAPPSAFRAMQAQA